MVAAPGPIMRHHIAAFIVLLVGALPAFADEPPRSPVEPGSLEVGAVAARAGASLLHGFTGLGGQLSLGVGHGIDVWATTGYLPQFCFFDCSGPWLHLGGGAGIRLWATPDATAALAAYAAGEIDVLGSGQYDVRGMLQLAFGSSHLRGFVEAGYQRFLERDNDSVVEDPTDLLVFVFGVEILTSHHVGAAIYGGPAVVIGGHDPEAFALGLNVLFY
jgi:hypothetical protein